MDIPPRKSRIYQLPISILNGEEGEYFINFSFIPRDKTEWLTGQSMIAWEQIPLTKHYLTKKRPVENHVALKHLDIQQTDHLVRLSTSDATAVFDKHIGQLVEFSNRSNILQRGPLLYVWRAPTDNDGIKLLSDRLVESIKVLTFWKSLGLPDLKYRLISFRLLQRSNKPITIVIKHAASGRENWGDFTHTHRYTLHSSGKLLVTNRITLGEGIIDPPRVGVSLCLRPGLEQVEWYGRGPYENYSDRKSSAKIGIYSTILDSEKIPYIMPQEFGHYTDVRWLTLLDEHGLGLKIKGFPLIEYNASHYSTNDLYHAHHTCELKPHPEIYLNIDKSMRGVGTASCGPDTQDQYRLLNSRYDFTYSLEIINTD